ncbi:hypothetical protein ACIRD3_12180 [Kitasatospora sp. NPDC093550]|uniref:hypothetical protein n=1 Tax=Kitasatospora sp. NPDC093550 TaxID=3364089 RepID=UPI00380317F3
MSSTTHVRRSRRAVVAATLGVLALGGSLALPAQAFAEAPHGTRTGTLTVQAPAAVGFAGRPVAFTGTITNNGTEDTRYALLLQTITEAGTPPHAITIDYKDPANGTWTPVPLDFHGGAGEATYDGTTGAIAVPAGATVTLDLRIGAPMGLPHDGASNGGFRSITLESRLTVPGSGDDLGEQVSRISVDPIGSSLAHVPATAVAGGEPIEFDAVLANPTPSAYTNLGNVLFVDDHATVQVRRADGGWTTLPKVSDGIPDDKPGVYLQGRDSSIDAGATTVTRVRVSYDATTPLGATTIDPCLFVNEGATPFRGTTDCSQGSTVHVVAPAQAPAQAPVQAPAPEKTAAEPAPETTATKTARTARTTRAAQAQPVTDTAPAVEAEPVTPTAPATAAPTGPAAPVATPAVPAATETESDTVTAGAAAALAVLGAGALLLVGRRRRRS